MIRNLLFVLVALSLVSASPTDPPVPETVIVERLPFPEFRTCITLIDRVLRSEGEKGCDEQSISYWSRSDCSCGDVMVSVTVRRPGGKQLSYLFRFFPDGRWGYMRQTWPGKNIYYPPDPPDVTPRLHR